MRFHSPPESKHLQKLIRLAVSSLKVMARQKTCNVGNDLKVMILVKIKWKTIYNHSYQMGKCIDRKIKTFCNAMIK
jgi:hypothetical protein